MVVPEARIGVGNHVLGHRSGRARHAHHLCVALDAMGTADYARFDRTLNRALSSLGA
jgi:hypothetical protein